MPIRALRYKGFGLVVQIPEGLTKAMRGLRKRALNGEGNGSRPALELRDPPGVSATRRDPRDASAFLTSFYGNGSSELPMDEDRVAEMPLEDQVASTHWYHTIELPGGIRTAGTFDHRPLVPHYGIPESLEGIRCLDVACSNGFWTFEFERRGGTVVAVDIPSLSELDFPAGTPPMAAAGTGGADHLSAAAFHIAHRALGSQARLVRSNVYSLDPAELGTFDFVHLGDVLLHLQNPLAALCRVRDMTAPGGTALIAEVFDPSLTGKMMHYLGGFDKLVWGEPSLDCLVQMVYDSGFNSVEVLKTYRTPARGHWRAIMQARPE